MPRFLSLFVACLLWSYFESYTEWEAKPRPWLWGIVAVVPFYFAWKWHRQPWKHHWETHPLPLFLLPLLTYALWLLPLGGLSWLQATNLFASGRFGLGLLPYLWIQLGFRVGETALLGFRGHKILVYVWRQTVPLLLLLMPFAGLAQVWEWSESWFPQEAEGWSSKHRLLALWIDFGLPLLMLLCLVWLAPLLFGTQKGRPSWQKWVNHLWGGRSFPPQVLFWPTQNLFPNAVALGFGPWRKVFVTDALQNQLREEELEAVLAHEVAHLKRGHLFSMLAGLCGIFLLISAVLWNLGSSPVEAPLLFGACICLGALIPFVAAGRTFEMQADLDAIGSRPFQEVGLIGALERLGGRSRRNGLRHLSVPRRIAELQWCLRDPHRSEFWQRRARRWRLALRGLFWLGLAASLWSSRETGLNIFE